MHWHALLLAAAALLLLYACDDAAPTPEPPPATVAPGTVDEGGDAGEKDLQGGKDQTTYDDSSERSQKLDDATRIQRSDTLAALAAVYGGPSAEGFGGAVFARPLGPEDDLEAAAQAVYQDFVGELWERWGEEAWMGPWRQVHGRPEDAEADIVAELQGIEDADARRSVPLVLDVAEDPEAARAALSAVFDDPAVQELAVYNVGDGEAMSGLLLAARGPDAEEGVFLVVLLD